MQGVSISIVALATPDVHDLYIGCRHATFGDKPCLLVCETIRYLMFAVLSGIMRDNAGQCGTKWDEV